MKIFLVIDDYIKRAEYIITGGGLLVMTVLIFVNVIMRSVLDTSLMWAEELTRYILIWVTCIGANLCVRNGLHVKMDLFHIKASSKVAKILICGTYVIAIVACFLIMKSGYVLVEKVYATGQFVSVMPWLKSWMINLAFPVFAILSIKDYTRLLVMNFMNKGTIIKEIGGEKN